MKRKKANYTRPVEKTLKRGDCSVVVITHPGLDGIEFAVAQGRYAATDRIYFSVDHDVLAGALDDVTELGPIMAKLGLLVACKLIGFNIALGPDKLAEAYCKWAGIDVAALKEEAAKLDSLRTSNMVRSATLPEQLELPLDIPSDLAGLQKYEAT